MTSHVPFVFTLDLLSSASGRCFVAGSTALAFARASAMAKDKGSEDKGSSRSGAVYDGYGQNGGAKEGECGGATKVCAARS